MAMTCGFRGMRSYCVYVAALYVWHSGSAEGKSALDRHGVPVLPTVSSFLVVLASNFFPAITQTMANYFLTDANGKKRGPYNELQLQSGITKGIITPTTPLETDGGHK